MEQLIEKENRDFLRAGTITAAIYNVNRDTRRHPQPLNAHDIFQIPRPVAPPPSKAEILRNADRFFNDHNKKVARMDGRQFRRHA